MDLLRKIFGYKKPNYEEWWERQQAKYRPSWAKHPDKAMALKEAEDEYNYRSGELAGISGRTVMFVTLSTAIFAAALVFFQTGHGMAVIASKLSAIAAAGAVIASLFAYAPRFKVLFDRFMSPETWVGLIQEEFDQYVKYMVRTARKTRPLDRYKRLHAVAAWCLIMAIVSIVVASIFR